MTALCTALLLAVAGGALHAVDQENDGPGQARSPAPDHTQVSPGSPAPQDSPTPHTPQDRDAEPSTGASGDAAAPGNERADRDADGERSDREPNPSAAPRSARSSLDRTPDLPRQLFQVGDHDPGINALQRRLKQVGFLDPASPEDGFFSTVVQEAVFRYQVANGVQSDANGVYGPHTRRSLVAA